MDIEELIQKQKVTDKKLHALICLTENLWIMSDKEFENTLNEIQKMGDMERE